MRIFIISLFIICLYYVRGEDTLSYSDSLEYYSILLKDIDSIAISGIKNNAYPGCQILVAKDSRIIYHKSFGFHKYDSLNSVKLNDLYDLASITKVAATTLAVMKLYDDGKLDINKTLGDYLFMVKGSNKEKLLIKDILAHQSGLVSWIPFYKEINDSMKRLVFSEIEKNGYSIEVAKNMYMRYDYIDTIWKRILKSPVGERKYLYSDIGMYFMAKLVEEITGMTIDKYLDKEFYTPMKLSRICYKPLRKYSVEEIVPTEEDQYFRNQLLIGYVHDPGAAMLGGIGGHAGLFGDSYSLGAIFQMLLNGGEYGGRRYLKWSTIEKFTSYQYKDNNNRRGLGFDKPAFFTGKNSNVAQGVSSRSFGHSGFTGTYVWADPESNIVYVFLCNRVYPVAENNKIIEMNIRTEIQSIIANKLFNRKNETKESVKYQKKGR